MPDLEQIRGQIDQSKYRQGRLALLAKRVEQMQAEEEDRLKVLEQQKTHAEALRDLDHQLGQDVGELIELAIEAPHVAIEAPREYGAGD